MTSNEGGPSPASSAGQPLDLPRAGPHPAVAFESRFLQAPVLAVEFIGDEWLLAACGSFVRLYFARTGALAAEAKVRMASVGLFRLCRILSFLMPIC